MPLIDTATSWLVDDVPLQTFAHNVEELDSKYGTPPTRGDNSIVAYRAGWMWMPKTPEGYVKSLGMWISGRDAGGRITEIGKELQFQKNMHNLQRLLYTFGRRQVKLTKRWRDPANPERVIEASAMAEVRESLMPKLEPGAIAARMVVPFQLSDPYFYGEETSVTLYKDQPLTIQVEGDVPTIRIKLQFHGPLSNGVVTNTTPIPDHWVKIGSSIATGDSITLNTERFLATRASDSGNMISTVTRSGGREWMEFMPGDNVLELTAASGAGTATLSWSPVYL